MGTQYRISYASPWSRRDSIQIPKHKLEEDQTDCPQKTSELSEASIQLWVLARKLFL